MKIQTQTVVKKEALVPLDGLVTHLKESGWFGEDVPDGVKTVIEIDVITDFSSMNRMIRFSWET